MDSEPTAAGSGSRFRLHPDAARNFDEKAAELLPVVRGLPIGSRGSSARRDFTPDRFVSLDIRRQHIIGRPVERIVVPGTGEEVGRRIPDGPKIEGETHGQFMKIVNGMARTKPFGDQVSRDAIAELLAEWLSTGLTSDVDEPMTEYVLRGAAARVARQALWIPVAGLYLESDVALGPMVLRTLTRDLLDAWFERIVEGKEGREREIVERAFKEKFRRSQARAAAFLEIDAEPNRALEIATDAAERAVALMRLFHPALLAPEVRCHMALLGSEHDTQVHHIRDDGRGEPTYAQATSHMSHRALELSTLELKGVLQGPLAASHRLLGPQKLTPFQADVLDALLTYSKAALRHDLPDRLIYILAALESLLLRDSSEPVQQNVADRLAFFLSPKREERMRVVGLVKETYGHRSGFVHHGKPIEKQESIQDFMRQCWFFFTGLLGNLDRVHDKAAFLRSLDEAKYG